MNYKTKTLAAITVLAKTALGGELDPDQDLFGREIGGIVATFGQSFSTVNRALEQADPTDETMNAMDRMAQAFRELTLKLYQSAGEAQQNVEAVTRVQRIVGCSKHAATWPEGVSPAPQPITLNQFYTVSRDVSQAADRSEAANLALFQLAARINAQAREANHRIEICRTTLTDNGIDSGEMFERIQPVQIEANQDQVIANAYIEGAHATLVLFQTGRELFQICRSETEKIIDAKSTIERVQVAVGCPVCMAEVKARAEEEARTGLA